jgi:PHD/YefM family antitoxin component YafN of YafNO toxin-antitoxin module
METLTPELKRAIDEAGDSPLRLTDPQTQRSYVLVSADVYDRMLVEEEDRLEQAAFLRASKRNAKARLMEDE